MSVVELDDFAKALRDYGDKPWPRLHIYNTHLTPDPAQFTADPAPLTTFIHEAMVPGSALAVFWPKSDQSKVLEAHIPLVNFLSSAGLKAVEFYPTKEYSYLVVGWKAGVLPKVDNLIDVFKIYPQKALELIRVEIKNFVKEKQTDKNPAGDHEAVSVFNQNDKCPQESTDNDIDMTIVEIDNTENDSIKIEIEPIEFEVVQNVISYDIPVASEGNQLSILSTNCTTLEEIKLEQNGLTQDQMEFCPTASNICGLCDVDFEKSKNLQDHMDLCHIRHAELIKLGKNLYPSEATVGSSKNVQNQVPLSVFTDRVQTRSNKIKRVQTPKKKKNIPDPPVNVTARKMSLRPKVQPKKRLVKEIESSPLSFEKETINEEIDLLQKFKDSKISLTSSRTISVQDKNFILQLAKSMNKKSIEEEISNFDINTSSLSFFLIKALSGKNYMNWSVEDVKEVLEEIIKFAIKGEKLVDIKKKGEVIGQKKVLWKNLMEDDVEDARTSLHTAWRDVIFENRGHFWKNQTDTLDSISIWLFDSFNVTTRSIKMGIKNTGINARKVNFVLRGMVESLFLDLKKNCPIDTNDEIYVEWKKIYNWKPKKLKLPAELAKLVPGAEIDPNWEETIKFLKKNRQIYNFDCDRNNTINRTEKSYFTIVKNDAELIAKYMKTKEDSSGRIGI